MGALFGLFGWPPLFLTLHFGACNNGVLRGLLLQMAERGPTGLGGGACGGHACMLGLALNSPRPNS